MLQRINTVGTVAGAKSSQASYHVDTFGYLYDPQFSPDGRQLLFKNGPPPDPGQQVSFGLNRWNFNKNVLSRVNEQRSLHLRRVLWSPNSRYISYIFGYKSSDRIDNAPGTLSAQDTFSRTTLHLTKNAALTPVLKSRYFEDRRVSSTPHFSFSWTPRNTLLFTYQNLRDLRYSKGVLSFDPDRVPPLPDIYEVGLSTRKPALLIRYGTNPVAAPDNHHIAFFGWAGEQAKEPDAVGKYLPALFLFDRATKQRTKIDETDYGLLQWTPDGQTLLLLDPKDLGEGRGQATLKAISLATRQSRIITTLSVQNSSPKSQLQAVRQFHGLKVSRNGRVAFVDTTEEGDFDEITNTQTKTWHAVDLASGQTSILARIENKWAGVLGWDWLDESTPAPNVTRDATQGAATAP